MSIINEALKKTEEHLQRNSAKGRSPEPAPKPSGPKTTFLYVLILLVGLLLANSIFNLLSHKVRTAQVPKKNTSLLEPTTNPPPAIALPSQPPEKDKITAASFVLNGIFFSDNNAYALINNQIVRENDCLDKAKVRLITVNTVELDNAGELITLTTRR